MNSLLDSISSLLDPLASLFFPSDFVIRHRPGRPVEVKGSLAKAKAAGIRQFFARELQLPQAVTVRGTWGKVAGKAGGPPRLRFSGNIGAGDRQRVRNYLTQELA